MTFEIDFPLPLKQLTNRQLTFVFLALNCHSSGICQRFHIRKDKFHSRHILTLCSGTERTVKEHLRVSLIRDTRFKTTSLSFYNHV